MKLLFLDTETGGANEKENSLLSIALVYWNNGNIIDKLELYIKEDNYNVTSRAMEINKLKLNEVYNNGVFHKEAVEKIEKFIEKHYLDEKAVLCGHNINFDIRFLKELYIKANKNFEERISYRSLDTASIIKFLSIAGKFGGMTINSLDDAINFFGISIKNRHTAIGDVEKTIEVFDNLIELVK